MTLEYPEGNGAQIANVCYAYWERFGEAYRREFQEWVDSIRTGRAAGPSAWDALAASAVTDAALEALAAKTAVAVRELPDRPKFYQL